jgi:molybdopterin molybdotransferase
MGYDFPYPDLISTQLTADFHNRGDRPVYHPAHFGRSHNVHCVTLVPWMGSADLRATVDANAMAVFPEGDTFYKAGTWIDVIPW